MRITGALKTPGWMSDLSFVEETSPVKKRVGTLLTAGCVPLSDFTLGWGVKIRIPYKNATIAIAGKVVHRELSKSFGIKFAKLDLSQKAILESWLEEIEG
jgi:hypothetical protein